ncbi:MAG: plasmid mobilization protein [Promethearchaeota archaeon]
MKNDDFKDSLIRIVPVRTLKKTEIITTRFTKEEKRNIDKLVEKYGTSLTDFIRNAVFYYIKDLEKKNPKENEKFDLIKPLIRNRDKLKILKNSIEQIENQIEDLEKKFNSLEVSNEILDEFLKNWKERGNIYLNL